LISSLNFVNLVPTGNGLEMTGENESRKQKDNGNVHGVVVNEVKFYQDSDFLYAKHLSESLDWDQVYRKKSTIVWVQKSATSEFDMIRVG
jgi:uncharacterized protein YkuJ